MPGHPPPPHGTPVWWLRTASADLVTFEAVASSGRPDGTVVERVSLPPGHVVGGQPVVRARMAPGTRRVLDVVVHSALVEGRAPGVVWREQVRRDLRPMEAHLQAFLHDDAALLARQRSLAVPSPGTVLTAEDVDALGLAAAGPIGAVRWNPASGEVFGVDVAPGHRRRRVATSLLAAAEACAVARGWPCLWGAGRLRAGEALCRGMAPWGVGRIRETRTAGIGRHTP